MIRVIALLCCCAAILAAQSDDSSCCRMTITVEPPAVLNVGITILGETPVTLFDSTPARDLHLNVVSNTGRESDRTAYGKRLLTERRASRNINRELKKGDTFPEKLDLREIYVLTPGTYHVTVSRYVQVSDRDVTLRAQIDLTIPSS
jgi:hypothetical protein